MMKPLTARRLPALAALLTLAACGAAPEETDSPGAGADDGGGDGEDDTALPSTDADGDGHDAAAWGGDDCDDTDASVHPGATETWYDGVDSDCDGASDDDADTDGHDALPQGGDDCDDTDASVYPGATETWYDGVDADCDGASDNDADGDGLDAVEQGGADCDDTDPEVGEDCPALDSPLASYEADGEGGTIEEIDSNLSGITWNPVTQTLMAVLDGNRLLVELSTDMAVLREIDLSGYSETDTEDIVYVGPGDGGSRYAIVTEEGVVFLGTVPDGATELSLSAWQTLTYAPEPEYRNRGGEGIAYDPDTETLYVCNEKDPMAVQSFALPGTTEDLGYEDGSLVVSEVFDPELLLADEITDISSCLWDPRTDHLLVLSHESRVLLDVDTAGVLYGSLAVPVDGGLLGKAEGVALLDSGDLMIVGEPNEWRRYLYSGD